MTRLTIPKFKSLISKGMSPDLVLEKVFKQYKGTIHDTVYWKKQIKKHINHYIRYQKTVKSKSRVRKSKSRVRKSKSKSRLRKSKSRSRRRKSKSRRKDGANKNDDTYILSTVATSLQIYGYSIDGKINDERSSYIISTPLTEKYRIYMNLIGDSETKSSIGLFIQYFNEKEKEYHNISKYYSVSLDDPNRVKTVEACIIDLYNNEGIDILKKMREVLDNIAFKLSQTDEFLVKRGSKPETYFIRILRPGEKDASKYKHDRYCIIEIINLKIFFRFKYYDESEKRFMDFNISNILRLEKYYEYIEKGTLIRQLERRVYTGLFTYS
jgi:hypothetical protein